MQTSDSGGSGFRIRDLGFGVVRMENCGGEFRFSGFSLIGCLHCKDQNAHKDNI